MPELTPDEKYDLGKQVGETIVALFKTLAIIDGMPLRDAIDSWVEHYVATRIIQEAGDTDATE